jgi:hypothetical protein
LASDQGNTSERVRLHAFTDLDRAADIKAYFAALEAFDALEEIQELKTLGGPLQESGPVPPCWSTCPTPSGLCANAPGDQTGGAVAVIEPDFGTNAINLQDGALVRRVLDHECDANIPHGWLVRDMRGLMERISACATSGWTRAPWSSGPILRRPISPGRDAPPKKPALSAPRRRRGGPRRSPISPPGAGSSAAAAIIFSQRGFWPVFHVQTDFI